MNHSHLVINPAPGARPPRPLLSYSGRGLRAWPASGAILGVGGGILAAFAGTFLSVDASIPGNGSGGFSPHGIGALLLFLAIPVLIFGGHCLDLLEGSGKTPHPESASEQPDSHFKAASFQSKPHLSKRGLEERLRLRHLVRARLQSGPPARRRTQRQER